MQTLQQADSKENVNILHTFVENAQHFFSFSLVVNVIDGLLNVHVRTANLSNDKEQIVLTKYFLRQSLNVLRECSTKHECLSVTLAWHVGITHQLPHRRQKAHV